MAWYLLVRHNSAGHHAALAVVSLTINKSNKTFHPDDPDWALGCLHVYRCIHTHTPQAYHPYLSVANAAVALLTKSPPLCVNHSLSFIAINV